MEYGVNIMMLAMETQRPNSRRYKVMKARLTLSSDIRTSITAFEPDGNIFDQMDRADEIVESMTDREVQDKLMSMGLGWNGQYWMKAELVSNVN